MSVEANTVYDVQIEILRTDTNSASEYAEYIKLNKQNFGKCDPRGRQCECTYGNCSPLTQTRITTDSTSIEVEIQFTSEVGCCTCKVGYNDARGAARITLTPIGRIKFIGKLSKATKYI